MTVLRWPCPTEVRVLSVEGPLRVPVSTALRHSVRGLIRRGERHIVVDLGKVPRIDAAGLGELVRAYNMSRAAKGTLRVVNSSAWVREVINRVGLLDLLHADTASLPIRGTAVTAGSLATAIARADMSFAPPIRRTLAARCELFRFPRA